MYSDAYFVKEHILLDQAEVRFRIETYFLVQIFKNNDSLIVFLCHINDLPDTVKSSVRLFADDCLLYREINSQNDHNNVQKDLGNLEKWAENWGTRFNATKCYIMSIKKKTHTFYQLGGHILEQVDSNPYLGLQISEDIEHHKEGQLNHRLPQTKFTTLSEGMQEQRLHLIS